MSNLSALSASHLRRQFMDQPEALPSIIVASPLRTVPSVSTSGRAGRTLRGRDQRRVEVGIIE